MTSPIPATLHELEGRLAHDLACLNHPPAPWPRPVTTSDGRPVLDVLVIGGGMCGLTAAFTLIRSGVRAVRVLDAAPEGCEGPWVTFARMLTLRSPKHLVGPAQGLPAATFRAWYEAQHGAAAWDALGRIPRAMWMDYLRWFRRVLDLPVENGVMVTAIRPHAAGFEISVEHEAGAETLLARKVILATGRERLARKRVPEAFARLPDGRVHHTADAIDFEAMRGDRVAVIGLAASAVDNAATALEAGAAEVTMLGRSATMPLINKAKAIVHPGFTEGFPTLSDADRWGLFDYILGQGVPAPRESAHRLARHPNFRLRMGSPVTRVEDRGDTLVLTTPTASIEVEHVILGTGFRMDVTNVPEIAEMASHIALWRDTAPPEASGIDAPPEHEFWNAPYLGPALEFTEREPGACPALRDLHCFTHAAFVSHGYVSGDIPNVADGAQRLVRGICADLFARDLDWHRARIEGYDELELLGDEFDGRLAAD